MSDQTEKTLIIFHDNCLDGFVSGMVAYRGIKYGQQYVSNKPKYQLDIVPTNYGNDPIPTTGYDNVSLVDFSYPIPVLQEMINNGSNVTVYDHHKSFVNSFLEKFQSSDPVVLNEENDSPTDYIRFHPITKRRMVTWSLIPDKNNQSRTLAFFLNDNENLPDEKKHSGASLTFTVMGHCLDDDLKNTVELARYHDLWLHKGNEMTAAYALSHWFKKFYKNNEDLVKRMKSNPETSGKDFEELMEKFLSVPLADKILEAQEELRSIREKLERLATSEAFKEVQISGFEAAGLKTCYIDSPEVWEIGISITGSFMLREKGYDIAIMNAVINDNEHVYSLRSNSETTDVDVAEICQHFHRLSLAKSGGGHRNAAGVAFSKLNAHLLFQPTVVLS